MRRKLNDLSQSSVAFVLFAGLVSFSAYFSMYAFRKPFTAATYDGFEDWSFGLDYKVSLVIIQVFGYALSKFLGVKFVSEAPASKRAIMIISLIGSAWLALVGFALLPRPYNVLMLFGNGLCLGMIWGLVFSYLEGRRTSEVLGAILCSSFILSSGVVKAVGAGLILHLAVPDHWMPAATGALFFPILAISVWGLTLLPAPDGGDQRQRTARLPMDASARRAFMRRYGSGVVILCTAFVLFTAFRDFRDNFAAEIWDALGYGDVAAAFALSEAPVAAIVLAVLAMLFFIKNNWLAVGALHLAIALGALTIGVATYAFEQTWLGPVWWMVATGAGLYIAYVPFSAMLFDRLMAAAQFSGTAVFLIYVADASGYLGSVSLLVLKELFAPELPWLRFFVMGAYATSIVGVVLTVLSLHYFWRRQTQVDPGAGTETTHAGSGSVFLPSAGPATS